MPILDTHLLSVLTFLPLVAVLILLFVKNEDFIRAITLITMVLVFIISIALVLGFDSSTHMMQFVEKGEWITALNINYHMGVDGISVLFILLTALIGWVCVLASWRAIDKRVKEFMICLLVMQTAMTGVFCSLDFFLFYIFWEVMLIPMYLIIGVWGGPRRVYAAVKFFLYTLAGSILMLVGVIALYFAGGETFDIQKLMAIDYSFGFQVFVFILFFLAFAIKVPMFPFHTWLPDAHVQAPTAGSIILAGVLLKMGTYGFLRFSLPMFPDASQYFAWPIIVISLIGIIYGAFLALSQEDMKKLIAYSSVSHMGFITMGIFLFNTDGLEGAILQMFNHGITTGALFLCVGLIYERTHSRELSTYGWAARRTPGYAVFLFIFVLASLGFPGTNGFIGEILILFGAYAQYKMYVFYILIGVVLGAAYILNMFKRVAFGEDPHHPNNEIKVWDIGFRETISLTAFLIFVLWIGFQPMPFLEIMHESVVHLISQVGVDPETGRAVLEAVVENVNAIDAVDATAIEAVVDVAGEVTP